MRKFIFHTNMAFAAAIFAAPMAAIAAVNSAPSVDEILVKTPAAKGVFIADDKGEARHIQSGMVCPLSFPNLNLWHLQVYDSPRGLGTDVGCDYGRQAANNMWTAKLTIYAVKAPGLTVDQAFEGYRAEVLGAWPGAKILGPALTVEGDASSELKEARSEEYDVDIKGVHTISDLIVAKKGDWVIEIRMSTTTSVGTPDDAAKSASDLASPAAAIIQALSTIGSDGTSAH